MMTKLHLKEFTMTKIKNVEFDVDDFIMMEDTMEVFETYRLNKPTTYDYIKIIIKQAYLQGCIDSLNIAHKDLGKIK